ncbi:MAG: peptidase U34 [Clostridiaceae bacterium]|jgi:dipeptidase|nr:peptidase U34 [Clostridiaceae bacterium]
MCDTLCAFPPYAEQGTVLFAKNSDRSPNEPHLVVRIPEKKHTAGSPLKLTYITIPQVEHTYAAILCKPSWIWGAEMGVNSASVAIGNEAVFTKVKRGPQALTGMDLVRLALERCDTAKKAVELITSLLEKYGQGGNCGFDHEFYYDNGFLVVDPKEGYVIETAGKRWVVVKVSEKHAISNRLSIRKEHILRGGVEEGFDFAGRLTNPVYTFFSGSKERRQCSYLSIRENMNALIMMEALRKHHPKNDSSVFKRGSVRSVCMHAGGLIGDHTTGSLVAVLRENKPSTLWVTGSSTPCISCFKPVFVEIDSGSPVFNDESEAKNYWLKREAIHRSVLAGIVNPDILRSRFSELENDLVTRERELFNNANPDFQELKRFSAEAAEKEEKIISEFFTEKDWIMPSKNRLGRYWDKKNRELQKL